MKGKKRERNEGRGSKTGVFVERMAVFRLPRRRKFSKKPLRIIRQHVRRKSEVSSRHFHCFLEEERERSETNVFWEQIRQQMEREPDFHFLTCMSGERGM